MIDMIGSSGYISSQPRYNVVSSPVTNTITGLDPNTYYNFVLVPYDINNIRGSSYYFSGFTSGASTFTSTSTAITSISTPVNYSNLVKPLCTLSAINSLVIPIYNDISVDLSLNYTNLSYIQISQTGGSNNNYNKNFNELSGTYNPTNKIYSLNSRINISGLSMITSYTYNVTPYNNINIPGNSLTVSIVTLSSSNFYFPLTDDYKNYGLFLGTADNSGCTLTTVNGKKCANFSTRTKYINLPSIQQNNNGYSIVFSFYITNIPTEGDNFMYFGVGFDNNKNCINANVTGYNNNYYLDPIVGNSVGYDYYFAFTFGSILNRWNHYVHIVKKTGSSNVYLNGALQTVLQGAGSTSQPTSRFPSVILTNGRLGYITTGPFTNGFIGSMRNFFYFDKILTQSEITNLFNNYL